MVFVLRTINNFFLWTTMKAKLLLTPADPYWEFYDLKNDPNENNNLYFNDNYKNLIKKLKMNSI